MAEEHVNVVNAIETKLLNAKANNIAIPIDDFYKMAGRDRLTDKFCNGVKEAGGNKLLLISFGDNIVAVTRDVAP